MRLIILALNGTHFLLLPLLFYYQAIVMEHTWKSHLNRRAMAYLHPNPFFYGVVRMLLVDHEVREKRNETRNTNL